MTANGRRWHNDRLSYLVKGILARNLIRMRWAYTNRKEHGSLCIIISPVTARGIASERKKYTTFNSGS